MARGKNAKNRTLEGPDDLDGEYADFDGLWDTELKNKVPKKQKSAFEDTGFTTRRPREKVNIYFPYRCPVHRD